MTLLGLAIVLFVIALLGGALNLAAGVIHILFVLAAIAVVAWIVTHFLNGRGV